jgi:hypothetical protein
MEQIEKAKLLFRKLESSKSSGADVAYRAFCIQQRLAKTSD